MRDKQPIPAFLSLLLAVLPSAAPLASAFAGDAAPPFLERQVALNLWGASLADAMREIQAQTGVEMLLYPPDFPDSETSGNLYLVSGRVELGTIVECLARRYSFRYRVSNAGRVELSRGYGWVGTETALRFLRLDGIAPPGGGDSGELRKLLGECVKPMSLLPGDFSLAVEKSPAPDNPHSLRAVAALPEILADYLERTVGCLSGEAGDYPPEPTRQAGLFTVARHPEVEWRAFLTRPAEVAPGRDVRRFLAEIANQTDAVFVLHSPPAAAAGIQEFPPGRMGLGKFTEEAAVRLQLGKRVLMAAGAVYFEPGAPHEWEMDNRNRELYWGGLAVAGFPTGLAAERSGGGEELASRIRREVFPGLWRDPAASIVYNPVNGRLAVVAPPNAIKMVAEKMREWGVGF